MSTIPFLCFYIYFRGCNFFTKSYKCFRLFSRHYL